MPPPILPVSGCGSHEGQYTGASICSARRCQPARHAAGHVAAARGAAAVGAAPLLLPPLPQPVARSARAASSGGSAATIVRLGTCAAG